MYNKDICPIQPLAATPVFPVIIISYQNSHFGTPYAFGETAWRDPRWPSLLWALVCLSFWTLLVGPVHQKLLSLQASRQRATRKKALIPQINF